MARFGRSLKIGLGSTPSGDIPIMRSIGGRSLELGDPTHALRTSGDADEAWVGWEYSAGPAFHRHRALIKAAMDPTRLAGAEIVSAVMYVPFSDVTFGGFTGSHLINVHLMRAAVDITDATWDEADDSADIAFDDPGGKAGVDYDSGVLGSITVDLDFYNAVVAGSVSAPYLTPVSIVNAVREAAEKGWSSITLFLIASWAGDVVGFTSTYFSVQKSSLATSSPHAYTDISYLPPLSFFALNPDGTINYGLFLDHEVADRDARILTGNPPPAGVGPTRSVAFANGTRNDLTRIAIVSARAYAESTTRPTSRRWPRFVEVLDDAAGEGYIDGSTRMEPVPSFESTRYRAYVTPAFGTENPTPLVTALGNSYGQYDRDETFRYNSKDAFTIRKEWWGLSPAAVVGDEQWTFKHKKDARPSGYTQEAAEAHEITQYEGLHDTIPVDRTQADATKWRDVWNATAQQCTGDSRVASFTSAGYGTLDRTHFRVGSEERFLVGSPATVFDADHVEHFIIDGAIDRTHGTNPDQIIAERELDHTYGADATIVSGLYVGDLAARDRSFLLVSALQGQNYLELDETFRAQTGTLRVYRAVDGLYETHTYTMSGNRANFSDAGVTARSYAIGDLVVVMEETSWVPFFVRLKPEEGAAEVENLSLIRSIRLAVK